LSTTALRVLVTEPAARTFGRAIVSIHPSVELVTMCADGTLVLGDSSPIGREEAGIEVAWATSDLYDEDRAMLRPFFGLVRRLDTLRWFQSSAAGFEAPVFGELIRKGILFTKSDVHSVPIAEYVLRAALDHFQAPQRWAAARSEKRWETHEFDEVFGSTWVVVGLGSIGAEVAARARALGAHVIGVRRRPPSDEPVDEMVTPEDLPAVLPRATVVVLCAPANPSTEHLVDDVFLGAMNEQALLVNIGRGSIVDEVALVRALDNGQIAAAVLDVFQTEPLPSDSPLWTHPKVTVTPHASVISRARTSRQAELFGDNLSRYIRGDPLRQLVTEADLD